MFEHVSFTLLQFCDKSLLVPKQATPTSLWFRSELIDSSPQTNLGTQSKLAHFEMA